MEIIRLYWSQILFFISVLVTFTSFVYITIKSVKCSLRNDILAIYDQCKKNKKITKYQLQALLLSSELYFKLKGNSFVSDIVETVKKFEVID